MFEIGTSNSPSYEFNYRGMELRRQVIFSKPFRHPPPVQWVSKALSSGVKRMVREAHRLAQSNVLVKTAWSYTSPPSPHSLIKHSVNFLSHVHNSFPMLHQLLVVSSFSRNLLCLQMFDSSASSLFPLPFPSKPGLLFLLIPSADQLNIPRGHLISPMRNTIVTCYESSFFPELFLLLQILTCCLTSRYMAMRNMFVCDYYLIRWNRSILQLCHFLPWSLFSRGPQQIRQYPSVNS